MDHCATYNTTMLSVIDKGTCSNQVVMQWLCKFFWFSVTCNFRVTARYIPTAANTLADATSRIHDPVHCELLEEKLISCPLSCNTFDALPLQVQSMLRNSNSMPSCRNIADRLSCSPQQLLTMYKSQPCAYFHFCLCFGYRPVPCSFHN